MISTVYMENDVLGFGNVEDRYGERKGLWGIEVINELPEEKFDSVVLAVAHQLFTGIDIESLSKTRSVVFDVKGFLPKESVDGRL